MRVEAIGRCTAIGVAAFILGLIQAMGGTEAYPETVRVSNPGNAADATGYGAVPYMYRIGKYEVTNEEYCEFLNAIKPKIEDKFWRWQMGRKENGGILRSGESDAYTYSVKEGMARKPAVLMNWYETLYFCNWLSNGKNGDSAESGPYTFTNRWGSMVINMPDHAALAVGKEPKWVLASEDEWYKAAYFDPDKPGGPGYWKYPAKSDTPPDANINSDISKSVGSYPNSASPYGTFDQGGNAWEWNESRHNGNCGVRGGSYWINDHTQYMHAGTRYVSNAPEFVYDNYGFRVVTLGGNN